MTLKYILFCSAAALFFTSCKPDEAKTVENTGHADSLMKALNSPELKAINQKILQDPNNADLYNERAKIYLALKQNEDAVSDAKRAIRIDSTKAEYYLTEADIFFAANETRNSKEALELIVKKFPNNTEGLLKLGELYYLVKQYDNAFAKINDALKINVNLAKAYYLKGSIYKETGDTAKAISSLETAIEQDNKNYGAFLDLGLIYGARRNTIALEYFENAISLNPARTDGLYAKAKLLQDLNKTDEAVAIYNRILKADSLHEFSLYNIGAIELDVKKDVKAALAYFTKAINANPKYAEAYFARGVCYQELKDRNNAFADYSMCLQLKPNYEPAVEALNSLGK
jgi:tetratricopeptide (TPR) repeat protein